MNEFESLVNLILLCIVNGSFAIIGITLNGLVVLTFRRSSVLRGKIFYFTIQIMSCVDLLAVTVGHPLLLASAVVWWLSSASGGSVVEFVADRLVFLFGGFSAKTIMVMSLDRYLAVLHPFYHERTITKRKLFTLALVLWSVHAFFWALSFKYSSYVRLIIPVIELTLLAYVNYKVFKTARQKRDSSGLLSTGGNVGNELRHQADTAKKAYIICLLVVLCFLVTFTPIIVFGALNTFAAKAVTTSPVALAFWVRTVLVINSTVNCLVLICKNNTLRKEAGRIVETIFPHRKDTHSNLPLFKHQNGDLETAPN